MKRQSFINSSKQFLYIGLLWCPICFTAIFIHKTTLSINWIDSTILLLPPMIIELFICLGTRFISKSNPIQLQTLFRVTFTHFVGAIILTGTWIILSMIYSNMLESISGKTAWKILFKNSIPLLAGISVALYTVSVLFHYLLLANRAARKAEHDALNQRLYATRTELKVLKNTIHPHFLFNSLNTIPPLIKRNPAHAEEFIRQLSDFFRYSLKYGGKKEVPIKEELEHIKNYLSIEKTRLGDRLQTNFHIDKNTLNETVLSMILLPLVENAIKHGISQCLEGGTLSISIHNDGDFIAITIENPYEKPTRTIRGEGMGIRTLEQRLHIAYGSDARSSVYKTENMFTVQLLIPKTMENQNVT